jgi:exopolyphosphatase / guanosine-5'-triphosphate,3'-diphosphate pyrophosphatase
MNNRLAILDLGTNTFHLLICERKKNSLTVLFKSEDFTWLGEGGLGLIGEKAFQRAINQIQKYRQIIDEHHVVRVVAFGTAALRRASNGDALINALTKICPMDVRIISGDEEATFIYYGVRQAIEMSDQPDLIMDIGGGSTEFIVASKEKIFWKQSFPLGGSVLKDRFHHHEPITSEEIAELNAFFLQMLQPLIDEPASKNLTRLIGAAGSFDSFASMIASQFYHVKPDESSYHKIEGADWRNLSYLLLTSDLEQRLQIKGLPSFRAPMIVVAAVLVDFVLSKFEIQEMYQSAFSLKEGAAWELTNA